MTTQVSSSSDFSPAPRASSTTVVLTSLAIIAAGYFGFMRPAQRHMQSLERQCNKLVVAVKKLQSQDDTARHGLRLINLLDAQSEKMTSAEQALARFSDLHANLAKQAEEMAQATAALQQIDTLRSEIQDHGQTLANVAAALSDMADLSVTIRASSEVAREAKGSLNSLGDLQSSLAGSIAVLSTQLSALEARVSHRSESLPQAEKTLAQMDQICEQLADDTQNLTAAKQQLRQLAGLKQEVLEQSSDVSAAEVALDQIWDLKDGLVQANGTLARAQKLALDMMLLEPVLDRVAKSLQPAAEATRLSRRAAAKNRSRNLTRSTQRPEKFELPHSSGTRSKNPKTRETAAISVEAAPWTSAINLFVAYLENCK